MDNDAARARVQKRTLKKKAPSRPVKRVAKRDDPKPVSAPAHRGGAADTFKRAPGSRDSYQLTRKQQAQRAAGREARKMREGMWEVSRPLVESRRFPHNTDDDNIVERTFKFLYPARKKSDGRGGGGRYATRLSSVPTAAEGGPARRAKNIARAIGGDAAQGRVTTLKNTATSIPKIAAGTVGFVGSVANDARHGRIDTLKKVPGEAAKDYKRRFGSSDEEQVKQIREEGIAADVADATIVAGGTGAAVGRALTPVAKAGKLGEKARRVAAEPRPKLRVTSGEGGAKPQPKSKNLIVAAGQKARDDRRRKKFEQQQSQAKAGDRPVRGITPEAPGEVVRTTRRRQDRDQRVAVSGQAARGYVRLKNKQDREVRNGIEKERRELRKATPRKHRQVVEDAEQLALEGLVHFDDPVRTEELLTARRAKVVARRDQDGVQVPRTRKNTNDDVARIDRVLKSLGENPSAVLSPAMREFHGKQVERSKRLRGDDQVVDDLTADVRRYMPLARTTGDADKLEQRVARIEAKHEAGEVTEAGAAKLIDHARSQFVATMRAKREELGTAEPVYVLHRKRQSGGFSDYAAGGSSAVAGVKRTSYKLHDTGTQDVTPGAYTQGVAKTLKRNVNFNTVADIVERNAVSWSRGESGAGRTLNELRDEIDARGLDERDWQVVDLGIYRKQLDSATESRGDDLGTAGDRALNEAVVQSTFDLKGAESRFSKTTGRYVVLPRAVADELRDMTRPAGAARRTFQKIQGTQSKLLLNLNPTFVPVQVVANTPLALFATRGKVHQFLAAQLWYRKLDTGSRDVVDEFVGISAAQASNQTVRYGAAAPDNRFVSFFQNVVDSDAVQRFKGSWMNPMNWNPWLDERQNAFFRRAVFYNQAKRQAAARMGDAMDAIQADAKNLVDVFNMPPGKEKIAALRKAEPEIERVAGHVNDWLGDYTRYTAKERATLKTGLLFYGFLRWSVKFTFYTLPVKHPIATAVLAKLGQLQNEEVIELLSLAAAEESDGKVTKEQAAARLRKGGFTDAFGRVWITHDGKLESIDLGRVNPFTSNVAELLDKGPSALPAFLSPVLQVAYDLSSGRSSFMDKPLHFGEDVKRAADITAGQAARYAARSLSRATWPVRAADNILNPEAQSDDSLPVLGDRPKVATSAAAKERAAERLKEKGSVADRAKALVPLTAKPDGTARAVAGRVVQEELAKIDAAKKRLEAQGRKLRPGTNYYTDSYERLLDAEKKLREGNSPKKKVVRARRYKSEAEKLQEKLDRALDPDAAAEALQRKLDGLGG